MLDGVIAGRCITYATSSLCRAKIIIWKSLAKRAENAASCIDITVNAKIAKR
jgi:hypothetical protein